MITKKQYNQYRVKLSHMDIKSYIDFNGNTFTHCDECNKKDCAARNIGCMMGETKPEIIGKIGR